MINSLIIIIIGLMFFIWGYVVYAKRLEKLWQVDSKNPVPSITRYDGVDYVPAKNWLVLFGHHFSSIAGAGPVIGPVIACLIWGWLPTLLWIVLGAVFIGGVHDFGSLITSVKEDAISISEISQKIISKKAKILFSLFVWLALILVVAVFAYLCADTFVKDPRIVIPSLGLIPVALIIGFLLYNLKMNTILVTIMGLAFMLFLIHLGNIFPMSLKNGLYIWIVVLFIYSYFASILPVNILLQPRDYLSSFLLYAGMVFALLGLFMSSPNIKLPAYTKTMIDGQIWPMLFVTVACGAVSGFHTLIASGTTSKQLSNEMYSRRIGYGAMLLEGLLAMLVVIIVASLNIEKSSLGTYLKENGPIAIFSQGYNLITSGILKNKGGLLAITVLNAFILTTLDTATRICRYITENLFNIKNRFFSTGLVLIISGFLALSGKWTKIWPAFGASNQLVASLALFVISAWLIRNKRKVYFTLPIGFFMFITTTAALVFQLINCLLNKDYLLASICVALIISGGLVVIEVISKIFIKRKE